MRSFNGLQKAMRRNSAWMARLGAVLTSLMWQQAPIAQISAPDRGGPPMMEERQIVKLFDRDGDRLLNRIEREAARDWLANQPRSGRFGGPNPLLVPCLRLGSADAVSHPHLPARRSRRRTSRQEGRRALRSDDAPHDLSAIRKHGMGAGAGGFQQHRRRGTRTR